MRINLRFKIGNITFFSMIAKTQRIEGVTSSAGKGLHYVLWDLEGCTLEQVKQTLREVQLQFGLASIFIISDFPKSFRAWCFSKVDIRTYMRILVLTDYVDFHFFQYTAKRGEATLRISNKKGREPQKIVAVLRSNKRYKFPKLTKYIIYDTGLSKKGLTLGNVDDNFKELKERLNKGR